MTKINFTIFEHLLEYIFSESSTAAYIKYFHVQKYMNIILDFSQSSATAHFIYFSCTELDVLFHIICRNILRKFKQYYEK